MGNNNMLYGIMRVSGLRKHRYNCYFKSEEDAFKTAHYLNGLLVNGKNDRFFQIFSITQERLDARIESAKKINAFYDQSKSGIIAHNVAAYHLYDSFEQFLNEKIASQSETTQEM